MRKHFALFLALTATALAADPTYTADELVEKALADNPELDFYQRQVAALPQPLAAEAPEVLQPLNFPSGENFRRAVLDLDAGLAGLYLAEFRFVLAGTVRLKVLQYQAATEVAATAADLAKRISALVQMLENRPTAGIESLIERRILEGAAFPFVRQAAEATLEAQWLREELNGLLGRPAESALDIAHASALPVASDASAPADPLLLAIRRTEIARGLVGLDAYHELESFAIGGWFTREGLGASAAVAGLTRPASNFGGTREMSRDRLLDDARRKMARAFRQRRESLQAARTVAEAIPPALIENLRTASDLAERQYRVGALGVNLLIEIHREYLNALASRHEAIVQAWRNHLDLDLLTLPATKSPEGKITVQPDGDP